MRIDPQLIAVKVHRRLEAAQQQRGLGRGSFFLARPWRWLIWMGLIALAVGVFCLTAAISMYRDNPAINRMAILIMGPLGVLGLFYGLLAVVEFFRMWGAALRPFVLVTPINLVVSRGSHRPMDVHRLADATEFHKVTRYKQARWKGEDYVFVFGQSKERTSFLLNNRQQIAALDEVLALAKAKGKGEAMPDWPGAKEGEMEIAAPAAAAGKGLLAQVGNPASELWAVVGLMLIVAVIVAVFAAR